ncbi:hypothetical protein C5B42_04200, partial [Candidatus Cerribacteria bacterium 'Amazon FNV 2010 28 9']
MLKSLLACFVIFAIAISLPIVAYAQAPADVLFSHPVSTPTTNFSLILPSPAPTDGTIDTQNTPSSVLTQFVESVPSPELKPWTVLQYIIHQAVNKGMSADLIVFVLMFPLVASIVAVAR